MSNVRPPKNIEDILEQQGYTFPQDHFRDYWLLRDVRGLYYKDNGLIGQCVTTGRGIEVCLEEYQEVPIVVQFCGKQSYLWYFKNCIYSDDKEAWLNG
jgi:hypothetical protein